MIKKKLSNLLVYGLTGMVVISIVTMVLTGIVSLLLFVLSPFAFADSIETNLQANSKCLECHGKPNFSIIRNGNKIDLFVDEAAFKSSIHGTNACASCHNDLGGIPHKKAIYGVARVKQVNDNCQGCHDQAATTYRKSIHGQLTTAGKNNAYCTDCHGTHNILRQENPAALNYWKNVPKTCTGCHTGNVKAAYNYSFHGISVRNGYKKSATCVDCHGAHQILPQENPKSLVNQANTPTTCAKCHAKAAAGFANGREHSVPQDKENAFASWITWKIFLGLIAFDVFMSGSIILFELSRKWRAARDHSEHPSVHTHSSGMKQ
ncbi:MAG TPA: cytochrome c3 family protein [Bacillota bacterium]|nr:cytochrome c3 family protein [Bacillota bacterium]